MLGIIIIAVEARSSPPNILGMLGRKMGFMRVGITVQWIETSRGWVRIGDKKWIPMKSVKPVGEIPQPPVIEPSDGNLRRVKWHSEMPEELINYGSFGIVRLYAHPKADKPHSITPDHQQLTRIFEANTPAAIKWMVGGGNTKFPMAEIDGITWIPTQGVYMGNYVKALREQNGFCQIEGMSAIPPVSECSPFTHPWLWHFMWCVNGMGHEINPPSGVAFFPVINPIGWKGANVGGEVQTEIWIESKWLK